MRTPESIADLGTIEAASQLVGGFGNSTRFAELATRWAAAFVKLPEGQRVDPNDKALEDALHRILAQVRVADADRARMFEPLVKEADGHALAAALEVLRAPPGAAREVVVARARACGPRGRSALAWAFMDSLWFACDLLGPPEVRSEPCDCGKVHESNTDGYAAHMDLVLMRLGERGASALDPDEEQVFAQAPLRSLFESRWRVLADIRRWRIQIPAIDEFARASLDDEHLWPRALAWLAGTGAHSEVVAETIARRIRSTDDVPGLIATFSKPYFATGGLFNGRGWKRDLRPRLLLPLTLALFSRGVWPARALEPLFRQSASKADQEASWRGVQEMLAEGLLAVALDETRPVDARLRAIQALGELRPGGDGSWFRALRKIDEPALAPACTAALRAEREHGAAVDQELAVAAATQLLFAADGPD